MIENIDLKWQFGRSWGSLSSSCAIHETITKRISVLFQCVDIWHELNCTENCMHNAHLPNDRSLKRSNVAVYSRDCGKKFVWYDFNRCNLYTTNQSPMLVEIGKKNSNFSWISTIECNKPVWRYVGEITIQSMHTLRAQTILYGKTFFHPGHFIMGA